jgi:hypothetical protein
LSIDSKNTFPLQKHIIRQPTLSSLHALGGYFVEQAISAEDLGKSADELLSEYIGAYDGPLIFHDNERWCLSLAYHLSGFFSNFISNMLISISVPIRV